MPKLPSNLSASYREQNERNHLLRTVKLKPMRWYVACARVSPDRVREDYAKDEFAILRARGLTIDEREKLRALVSDEQKRRYKIARRIEQSGW